MSNDHNHLSSSAILASQSRSEQVEELRRQQMKEALQSNQYIGNILESIPNAFFKLDSQWRFTYLNAQFEPLIGRSRAELLGKNIWEEFPEAVGRAFYHQYHRAVAEQVTVTFDEFYPPLGIWLEVRASPSPDGLDVYFHDINARKNAEAALLQRTRLAEMNAEVAQAVTDTGRLEAMLSSCAQALVQHLDAAFARIWILNPETNTLELKASRGLYTHLDGPHSRIPVGQFKIGLIAQERRPHLTNELLTDPRLGDPAWAKREGMVAFAGYPLLVDDRIVGVVALFSREPLGDATLQGMSLAARSIALGIERKRSEVEHEQLIRSLEFEQARSKEIFANISGFVAITRGPELRFELVNAAFCQVAGHRDVLGKKVLEAFPELEGQGFYELVERVYRTGEPFLGRAMLVQLQREPGAPLEERFLDLLYHPLVEQDGSISGVFQHGIDITEQVRARREAEAANRLKDEFLATLSHELRTPLQAILGYASLLKTGKLEPADAARALEVIERNALAQGRLVEDVLDVSRILTGKLRLDMHQVDLASCIHGALDAVRPASTVKDIRLVLDLDPTAGLINGDATRLQQVMWNLLSNAIKFTPKGGRVMALLDRSNSSARITVSDTGKGIAPQFLPHVFDRFRQADSSSTRAHSGLGLGLAIVRQMVELHGGTIEAFSAGEGLGATFTVLFPLSAVVSETEDTERESVNKIASPVASVPLQQPTDTPPMDMPPTRRELEGVYVLVVEDEADARTLIRIVLQGRGARVTMVGSVAEAMKVLHVLDDRPDVVLSDIGMAHEDGYALIKQLRAMEAELGQVPLPAVALTAFARNEDRTRALQAGFDQHVTKPVVPAELVAVVRQFIEEAA